MRATDADMTSEPNSAGKVLRFGMRGGVAPRLPAAKQSPVSDLSAYADTPAEPDDYRHRMKVNAAALVVVVVLVSAGLWIADTMAQLRKDQECVLSGRRACAPVAVVPGPRY